MSLELENTEIKTYEADESTTIDGQPKPFPSIPLQNNEENDFESDSNNFVHRTKLEKCTITVNTDPDEDINMLVRNSENDENSREAIKPFNGKKHKRLAVIDSDSEVETETEAVTIRNESLSGDILNSSELPVFNTNLEEELGPENDELHIKTSQATRLSLLCDPESSEEEADVVKNEENKSEDEREITPKKYKKKRKSKENDVGKPKKMTGKDAANLRKEIKSESQRMIREKNVSLPYHKPKSFTLKEFLSRRPKFSSAVEIIEKASPSVAIKMSVEQLTLVSKKLKEREKEVKEFYKSDSESEDDYEDKDYVPSYEVDTVKIQDNSEQTSQVTDNHSVIVSETEKEAPDPQLTLSEVPHTISDVIKDREVDFHLAVSKLAPMVSDDNKTKDSEYDDKKEKCHEPQLTLTENDPVLCVENQDTETGTELTLSEKPVLTIPDRDMALETNVTKHADNLNLKDCDTAKVVIISNVLINTPLEAEQESNQTVDKQLNIITKLNEDKSLHKELDSHGRYIQSTDENSTSPETLTTVVSKEHQCSMDYEFNLDGLEENSESLLEKETLKEGKKSQFEYSDLDREIENFGLADTAQHATEATVHLKNLSKLEMINEHIANIKPKLTGGPDDVIDLETGIAKPNEITKLRERFLEHNFKKPTHKNKVQLSIVSIESGEIHKETVAMKLNDESEAMVVEEKPGAKLQKLRDELQRQMAQKRSEMWQMKATKEPSNEEKTYEGEKDHCGLDDVLDDEEEEVEMSESSEEEEETEEDVSKEEKKQSIFIDEEAEESDEEDDEIIEATSENENANEEDDENCIDDLSEDDDQPSHVTNESEIQPAKKSFKKILKGFTEDSDEEDFDLVSQSDHTKNNENTVDIASQEDEYIFPPHQPLQNGQTPVRQITQNKSDFEFLTPISYITGLQNLNSASKCLKDSPVISSSQKTNEPSPLKENNWQRNLQKKLFMDTEITDSQVKELCSGKFPETQEANESNLTNKEDMMPDLCFEEFPSTSNANENMEHLVELCSGKFPSTAGLIETRLSDQTSSTQDLLNICSGEFTGITQNESVEKSENISNGPIDTYLLNTNKEVKSLDDDQDLIISQLIDEEEMEKFKKRFESPISNTQRRIVKEFEEAIAGGGVIDSDDEADTVEIKRKNQKRLMFSDDDDSEDDNIEEEVIDLHDDVEDDDSNVEPDDVAYDSEENEIELEDNGAGAKLRPSDFFENEAELSESEWGSADEDEKDLDTMEFEQGDSEKFDEKKIKSDLEKIHMRRLLDDDTREVKLLQEMLLEDGELHGSGRERQFRWKNIDSVVEGDEGKKEEDDVYLDEEESEEQWRKRRHEREMFLKEKLKKSQASDEEDLLSESQLLKIGQKVIQRSQPNSENNTPIDKTNVTPGSPVLKQPYTLLNKRGSFLSRSDQVLQRLAEYNKVTSVTLGTVKNSRNFLFQSVTVEEEISVSKKHDKKRKATDGTPNVIKKLRLSDNLSPAVKKKPSARAKLFSNW